MAAKFSELVVNSPYPIVKGFIVGFMKGTGKDFPFYFHRKTIIDRETLGEYVREVFHMECHTHLCLPTVFINEIKNALKKAKELGTISIESEQEIKSAKLKFSFNIYDEAKTGSCKKVFKTLPEGIKLINYNPMEFRADKLEGVSEFGNLNQYMYEASGTAFGEFEGIIEFKELIKKLGLEDDILCGPIKLEF